MAVAVVSGAEPLGVLGDGFVDDFVEVAVVEVVVERDSVGTFAKPPF